MSNETPKRTMTEDDVSQRLGFEAGKRDAHVYGWKGAARFDKKGRTDPYSIGYCAGYELQLLKLFPHFGVVA